MKRQVLDDANRLRLIKFRKLNSLTQKELARRMRVSEIMINQCETGNKQPSINFLDQWATALGLELRITLRRMDQ